ncbi:MAG: hypothetical protein WCL14_00800 [Bacteroidota bacterium]
MPQKYDDYIPRPQSTRKAWYQFQIDNADVKGAALGMTVPQITAFKALCQAQIDDLDALELAKANYEAAVTNIKTHSKVNNAGIRKAVALAKTNALYTPGRGVDMKVVDTHVSLDFEFYTPTLEAFVFSGYVRLKFDFNGLESMNVYRRITGTADWGKPYANVQHSPYDDHGIITQPIPAVVPALITESRDYRIIGVYDDVEAGFPSATHKVVFGG